MSCRTWKNHQILRKLRENEENLAIFTVILMAAFGTKNAHYDFFSKFIVFFWRQLKFTRTRGGYSTDAVTVHYVQVVLPALALLLLFPFYRRQYHLAISFPVFFFFFVVFISLSHFLYSIQQGLIYTQAYWVKIPKKEPSRYKPHCLPQRQKSAT